MISFFFHSSSFQTRYGETMEMVVPEEDDVMTSFVQLLPELAKSSVKPVLVKQNMHDFVASQFVSLP